MIATPDAVHAFWFGEPAGALRKAWFEKSDAFDAELRERFLATFSAVASGACDHWRTTARGALAYVVVLDQFPRNMFRGTPRAFAADAQALACAREIVWRRWDAAMLAVERQFAYLPFEHAEDLAAQRDALRLFAALDASEAPSRGLYEWAKRHHDIIERFGRFPHRNAILGRPSSADEIAFLATPGSSF